MFKPTHIVVCNTTEIYMYNYSYNSYTQKIIFTNKNVSVHK